MQIELGFGAGFEVLRGDKADACGQEFIVEIVHGEGRAGIDEKDVAGVVFAKSGFAPLAVLLAPLIRARALDEAQILQRGSIVFQNVREMNVRRVQIENAKTGKRL